MSFIRLPTSRDTYSNSVGYNNQVMLLEVACISLVIDTINGVFLGVKFDG